MYSSVKIKKNGKKTKKMKFIIKKSYYRGIVYEWNLPSGFTCPFASECLVKVDRHTGKFDNKSTTYRCYSASSERFPTCRESRWKNFDFVKNGGIPQIPQKCNSCRIHASGDFYSQAYFDMWIDLCNKHPNVEFWAYTKSLKYWISRIDVLPKNLVLTASYGGRNDNLIQEYGLKFTKVIKNKADANGMPIDYNDDEARKPNVDFCLLDNHIKK